MTNFAPHFYRGQFVWEIFLIMRGGMLHVSKLRKLLVFLDIGQHNTLEIFPVKGNIVLEISKELLKDIFA